MNSPASANPAGSTTIKLSQTDRLIPPFSKESAIRSIIPLGTCLPATFRCDDRIDDPTRDIVAFLKADLGTPKLNKIHRYLWLAGLPRPARPLHRQRLLGRTIYPTEVTDEHLIWHETHILVKPIPEYLLDFEFWEDEICPHAGLYASACGLLLSYAWLVSCRIDLNMACEMGLLPSHVKWSDWVAFTRDFVSRLDCQMPYVLNDRFVYGELRLSRLNSLYHFGAAGFSLKNLVHGYMSGSRRYTTFFEQNFGWLLAVFVYVTVILSAMQVALGTDKFGQDARFQSLSYGTALLSVGFVLAAVGVALAVWVALFWFHLISTLLYCKKAESRRRNQIA